MFVRTSSGNLINLDKVKEIYVSVDKENICSVKAIHMDNKETALYKDKEMQFCLEYLKALENKIAMKVF